MLGRVLGALAVLSVAACAEESSAVPGSGVPVEEVAAAHGGAVWRVETDGCGWLGSGSAFAVDEHHLVTNHHVIANDTSPQVRSRDGDVRQGKVIGTDPERDVAVIAVAEPLPSWLPWAPTDSLRRDERVVVLSYPRPEHRFTVSYGTVVAFASVDDSDDAEIVLSNAPIDLGSSGSPALRGDGSVVGVVTRVVLDEPTEYVSIIHTAARVRDPIEAATHEPADVAPDCGLGPDYIPPLPDELNIDEPPPPPDPAVTSTTDPPATATILTSTTWQRPEPSRQPRLPGMTPTTSALDCPSGTVPAAVTEHIMTVGDDGTQRATSRGTVTNNTSQPVVVEWVEVTFGGPEPVVVRPVPQTPRLEPGARTAWEATAAFPGSGDPPPEPSVAAAWRWSDERLQSCPRAG